MTLINFDLRAVAASGRVPVDARIRWQPVERRADGGVVVLPEAHSVTLVDGVASADLDPGYYTFTEVTGAGMTAIRLVPEVGPVGYGNLALIDPATMSPVLVPEAAWYADLHAIESVAQDAANSAAASRDAATASQGSAANSATAASGSATDAANSATAAGNSAAAAGSSATAADNSARAASGSATAAAGSASNAASSATAADTSRQQAQQASADVTVARATMVNGGSVDNLGHLILARLDGSTRDAGYVVGPPLTVDPNPLTSTGPDYQYPGPAGPTGPKGDPGGLTLGTLLAPTQDLNLVVTAGLYRIEGAPNTGLNWPVIASGTLTVIQRSTTNFVEQIFSPLWANNAWNGTTLYHRWMLNGAWSSWKVHSSQRVDQTAGRAIYTWDDANNREQLVWGDTGWRVLDAEQTFIDALVDGTNVTISGTAGSSAGGIVRARRMGSNVFLKWTAKKMTAGNPAPLTATLPMGWRPSAAAGGISQVVCNSAMELLRVYMPGGTSGNSYNGPAMSGGLASFSLVYPTDDTWPTTLPGAATGSIPNA